MTPKYFELTKEEKQFIQQYSDAELSLTWKFLLGVHILLAVVGFLNNGVKGILESLGWAFFIPFTFIISMIASHFLYRVINPDEQEKYNFLQKKEKEFSMKNREIRERYAQSELERLETLRSAVFNKRVNMNILADCYEFLEIIKNSYENFGNDYRFKDFSIYGGKLAERVRNYESENKRVKISHEGAVSKGIKINSKDAEEIIRRDAGIEAIPKERKFIGKKIDFEKLNKLNADLGLKGELAIMDYEKNLLRNAGRADLADKVEHVSKTQGDGTGYDIRSFSPNGDIKYIEVKTTKNAMGAGFTLTGNELAFMEQNPDEVCLYRIFNFDKEGRFGELHILEGYDEILESLDIRPSQYNANIK